MMTLLAYFYHCCLYFFLFSFVLNQNQLYVVSGILKLIRMHCKHTGCHYIKATNAHMQMNLFYFWLYSLQLAYIVFVDI